MVLGSVAVMGRRSAGQWRPITSNAASQTQNSRPLAPVGVLSPPKPKARPTDLFKILPSYSLNAQSTAPMSESTQPTGPEEERTAAPDSPRKLIATILEAVLATLRSSCAAKAVVSLLSRIHGKHPGLKL